MAAVACTRRVRGKLYMASSSWAATMTIGQCACRRQARATGPMASVGGLAAGLACPQDEHLGARCSVNQRPGGQLVG